MATVPKPAAEHPVDMSLVRLLLVEQHPDLAELPLSPVASGWDNVVFRLGDDLAVRLPRRASAAALAVTEQRWLPLLARHLPLPVPAPVRTGAPGAGYPWPWSVVPWLPGRIAARTAIADPEAAAATLGAFVAALATPAPANAPVNPFRGVPLRDREAALLTRVEQLGAHVDRSQVLARWREAVAVAPWPGPDVWLHGDLHPANLLVHRGQLSAVIDFGDLTAGDPAADLAAAWMLFDPPERAVFRQATGRTDDGTWVRARGNALAHAIACLASAADDAVIGAIGARTLARVLDDG
jgi:aminoglycoside phosphotransferase (APT) family kinase protein